MTETNKTIFISLESLRGVAALAIAYFHFYTGWGGYLAVDFFLVLSGFILYHNYVEHSTTISFKKFVGLRLARLYPLHIFTLIIYGLVFLFTTGDWPNYEEGRVFTLIQHVTLTQGIGISPCGWNYPSWSISVEFWINLLFFLFIGLKTRGLGLFLVTIGCFVPIAYFTGHLDTHSTNYFLVVNSGLLRGIASFLLGVLAYRGYKLLEYKNTGMSRVKATLFEIMSLIAVGGVVFLREGKHSILDFVAPFMFSWLIIVFALDKGWFAKVIGKIKYFGTLSYSIYLNQMAVLLLLELLLPIEWLEGGFHLLVYMTILILYSHFTYQWVEKTSRNWWRKRVV